MARKEKEKKSFWVGRTVNTDRKDMVKFRGWYYITSSVGTFLGSATAGATRGKDNLPPETPKLKRRWRRLRRMD